MYIGENGDGVMKVNFAGFGLISGILVYGIYSTSVNAQVIPDATLKTAVSQSGNNFTITNGDRVGNNLFHSFSQFSIPSQGSAFFDNASDIQNIFSRVTGSNISNIDGLIQANGSANLFLLNPNGIIFGQNAKLDIGGSFVGTTANSIKFQDGTEFSAVNPTDKPLLTMSVPVGLQFETNPKPIQVEGIGHKLTKLNPLNPTSSPINSQSHSGLQLGVQPLKTLALIGGDISLVGGTLEAIGGRIELGSVGSGMVSLNPVNQGWTFGYDGVQSFRDISMSKRALADASGSSMGTISGGTIQIQGARVSLIDGSVALIQNLGLQSSGGIKVQAYESVDLIGVDPNGLIINSSLRNESLAVGSNGDITVRTRQLLLKEGGSINSLTYGPGASGNITLEVADSLKMLGLSPISSNFSNITTTTYGTGNAKDISISTRELTIFNGGTISTTSIGSGASGDLTIKATELIELSGFIQRFFIPSSISSASLVSGDAGNMIIDTRRLIVSNGGRIDSSTTGSGKGGNLIINATDSIEVKGAVPGSRNPSLISSSGNILDESLRLQLKLPPTPTGDSGSLTINTGRLSVTDGALVNAQNEGSGKAGMLDINAGSIFLNNYGSITTLAKFGGGGHLKLQVQDTLLAQRDSKISAEAGEKGSGGNITINAPLIIGLKNSDITANAFIGSGGDIKITTEGIFGLDYRHQSTENSDITASSQFSVNGNVQINNIGVNPNSGLVELPENVTDLSQQIASGCSTNQGSSFVATGRGGIPQNPSQEVRSDRPWSDIRDISAYRKTQSVQAQIPKSSETLVQATGWYRNARGKIELVADKSSTQGQQPLTCAAIPQN
jgi:filamentous hemagglutinin family protein